jgi:hypothetical protein
VAKRERNRERKGRGKPRTGDGDYTAERHKWLDEEDVATVARHIRERRKRSQ